KSNSFSSLNSLKPSVSSNVIPKLLDEKSTNVAPSPINEDFKAFKESDNISINQTDLSILLTREPSLQQTETNESNNSNQNITTTKDQITEYKTSSNSMLKNSTDDNSPAESNQIKVENVHNPFLTLDVKEIENNDNLLKISDDKKNRNPFTDNGLQLSQCPEEKRKNNTNNNPFIECFTDDDVFFDSQATNNNSFKNEENTKSEEAEKTETNKNLKCCLELDAILDERCRTLAELVEKNTKLLNNLANLTSKLCEIADKMEG
ncbi:MAG: hypothetical protein MHPSP_000591, partial [Paramarteilia canceri]